MIKKLGIPKEVKQDEGRVALIPEHITQSVSYTHLTLPTTEAV